MDSLPAIDKTNLSKEEKIVLQEFCKNLITSLDSSLHSIVLYGRAVGSTYESGKHDINILIIIDKASRELFKKVLTLFQDAQANKIEILLLTEWALTTSTDVYPILFNHIINSSKLIYGKNFLDNLKINKEHLRLQCERQVKNLQIWLHRYYIISRGKRLCDIIIQKIDFLIEMLQVLLFLIDKKAEKTEDILNLCDELFGLDKNILKTAKSLSNLIIPLSEEESEILYFNFIDVIEKTSQIVDQIEVE